jgi:2-oxoglutarate ferredoxin oxidoreductase subunit alpha
MKQLFSFKIGGPAGYGIMSAGLTFSKIATRSGYHIYDYTEYPSIIRGGHNVMQTVVGEEPVFSPVLHTDFLVALNQETIELHKHELRETSGILYDSERQLDTSSLPEHIDIFGIPLVKIAKDLGGIEVMRNTVAMGATMALLGGELQLLKDLIAEEFGDKKPEITELNHQACQAGYDYARKNFKDKVKEILKPRNLETSKLETGNSKLIVLTANEAVAAGAIAAGLQFAAIYPMTPTSNILHTLAPLQEKYGFIYKQPEDEISAINMAIGAAFAGARAMVATSGGGFCLMTEGYGLAGITETPLVIIEGMRGAPATGLPTWTEQGDLRFVLHAHQGDFPRIILAAGDAEEAFHLTMLAFNLAEKYQTPVAVLIDKMLCESHQSFAPFQYDEYQIDRGKLATGSTTSEVKNPKTSEVDGLGVDSGDYHRYALSDDGISPRALPGQGLHFVANSDEHTPIGYSDEEADNRLQQMQKRMQKLQTCRSQDMAQPVVYGPPEADITLVSWGSNKGSILQAMKQWNNGSMKQSNNITINYIHNTWMNPFPAEIMRQLLLQAKYLINIECNYSAQHAGLIKQHTGLDILDNLLKYDGRPIYPEEIVAKIKSVVA